MGLSRVRLLVSDIYIAWVIVHSCQWLQPSPFYWSQLNSLPLEKIAVSEPSPLWA